MIKFEYVANILDKLTYRLIFVRFLRDSGMMLLALLIHFENLSLISSIFLNLSTPLSILNQNKSVCYY